MRSSAWTHHADESRKWEECDMDNDNNNTDTRAVIHHALS